MTRLRPVLDQPTVLLPLPSDRRPYSKRGFLYRCLNKALEEFKSGWVCERIGVFFCIFSFVASWASSIKNLVSRHISHPTPSITSPNILLCVILVPFSHLLQPLKENVRSQQFLACCFIDSSSSTTTTTTTAIIINRSSAGGGYHGIRLLSARLG